MKEKKPVIEIGGKRYLRIPIKTGLIKKGDNLIEIIKEKTKGILKENDIITISESAVACSQGRAIPIKEIKVSFLAKLLWRFVRKVPYGIGLRNPYSMECAIRECGKIRILIAAIIGGITKLFGRRGDFYRIAGKQAAMIDAPYTSGIKEYYECVIMGPKNPEEMVKKISSYFSLPVAIVDVNDIGGSWVIASSDRLNKTLVEKILKDNPAGQGDEMTPIVIIRELK
ncbi:MAG: coenzyme F420-0:L-glutamate ligase [candidate division WOR-3 bacterium]|nr:coenzyme F420-0:L-glutamate ligase [candidate division WOR-3 bacterium]MDW8114357.1 coenzyme F420-0:L-glutamate ligase [candidate division WOR-3 bacterium]